MHRSIPGPLLALWPSLLGAGSAAQSPPMLRMAVDAAWALSSEAGAQPARRAEIEARRRATSSLLAGPPSVSMSHRTDRLGSNSGLRESEVELAVPLWSPSLRDAAPCRDRSRRL